MSDFTTRVTKIFANGNILTESHFESFTLLHEKGSIPTDKPLIVESIVRDENGKCVAMRMERINYRTVTKEISEETSPVSCEL